MSKTKPVGSAAGRWWARWQAASGEAVPTLTDGAMTSYARSMERRRRRGSAR